MEASTRSFERLLMLVVNETAQVQLLTTIVSRGGWRSVVVRDSETALATLGTHQGMRLSAVVLDQGVAGEASCDLISELKRRRSELPVLMLGEAPPRSQVVEAMRAGASDYLRKPLAAGRLLQSLRLVTSADKAAELQPLAEKLEAGTDFETMIGAAPAFRRAIATAAIVARGHGNVLVEGEGGSGKDMLMRAVQAASLRAKSPFRLFNVRSVVPGAVGSALFGHEKDAMPGAFERQVGAFEQCDGGTLMIDEVNRLPPDVQARLAETIARGRVEPVGAKYGFQVNVRIIAGSNQSLAGMVEQNRFNAELYEALSSTIIFLPPLRERIGDLPALARHLVGRAREEFGLPDLGLADDAVSLLCSYDWPGNVRQLQAVLLRAAVLCRGDALTAADFPELKEVAETHSLAQVSSRRPEHAGVAFYTQDGNLRSLEAIEQDVVRLAIGHYQGRMSEVARRLCIGRSTLYRKLGKLGIESPEAAL